MNESQLQIGGAVVFTRLAKLTNRQDVVCGLDNRGLVEYVPEPRTKIACLRTILPEVYPSDRRSVKHAVKPVKNGVSKGFAVVRETTADAHAGDDWGTVVATAKLHNETEDLDLDPYDYDKRADIITRMNGASEWLTNQAVNSALVKLLEEHCDGIPLRANGGVYWVRADRLDEWAQIADVFETAKTQKDRKNAVYVLRVAADEQMVRAVGDSLTDDVLNDLAQIEGSIREGDLTERVCLTRLRNVGQLEAKAKRYEDAFEAPLSILRGALRRTSDAVAQATLQAGAAAMV